MKKNKLAKLALRKNVIAQLGKDQMTFLGGAAAVSGPLCQSIVGCVDVHVTNTCFTKRCQSDYLVCNQTWNTCDC